MNALARSLMVIAAAIVFNAKADDLLPTRAEFEALKQRLAELESIVEAQAATVRDQHAGIRQEQNHAYAHAANQPAMEQVPISAFPAWLSVSGAVEVEAAYDRTGSAESSDLVLATVALDLGVELSDWVHGQVGVLYEEDETESMDLDTGTLTLGNTDVLPFSLTMGKMYLPFGDYCTHMVSDPLTLEIGETRESGALLSVFAGPFTFEGAIFNGDVDKHNPDTQSHLDDFVLAICFAPDLGEGRALEVSASYLSNLADSDTLQDEVATGLLTDRVAAWCTSAHVAYGQVGVIGEYLQAIESFGKGELAFAPAGESPDLAAWYVEGYAHITSRLTMSARYERAHDLAGLLPAQRYGVTCSYDLLVTEHVCTTLSLEYMHGRFDDDNDTREDTVTMQLALGF